MEKFQDFKFMNSLLMAMFSTYCFMYFGNQMIWRWLLFNTWCAFIAFELYTVFESYEEPVAMGRWAVPTALFFWSCNEIGDIILFYYRYLIVKTEPVEKWFLGSFFGFLFAGFVTRFTQFCLQAKYGGWNIPMKGSQYLEPIYFMFLLICELELQIRYVLAVLGMKGLGRQGMVGVFMRSAGARMIAVTAPLAWRMVTQFAADDKGAANTVAKAFHTSVNLFTLLDLLLMKIEIKEVQANSKVQQTGAGSSKITKTADAASRV